MNYNDVFGKYTVPPSRDSYASYELIADTQSYWPDNYAETGFTLAAINDLTSTGVYSLTLPPANQVSVGKEIFLANVGSFNILVKDNAGVLLYTLPPNIGSYFYVTDNDTTKGEWSNIAHANIDANAILTASYNAQSAEASKVQAENAAIRASNAAAFPRNLLTSNTLFETIYDEVIDLGVIVITPFAIEHIPNTRVDLASTFENTQYDFEEL